MYNIPNMCKGLKQRLLANWNYFKAANQGKNFLLFNYIFFALLYRRIICPIIAFFLAGIYICIYPFVKLRFIKLIGSAIGHYSVTTELLLIELAHIKNDKFINIFYIDHSLYEESICNTQLHIMWKRIIFILPLQFSAIISVLDKFIMFFMSEKLYGMYGAKTRFESRWLRDPDGSLQEKTPFLKFYENEHVAATETLKKIGIQKSDKYICLLIRSGAYNKNHPVWHYPERNADTSTYMKACLYLAEKGYFVLRMGKKVDDMLTLSHPKIIDYARSEIRSDFMDIYLSANCHFFITTGSGLDGIPQIFRKPILYTNYFVLPSVATWYPHYLFIFKNWLHKKTKRMLTFQEQIYYFHANPDFVKRTGFHISDYVESNNLEFLNNTEDEILDAVEEMTTKLEGSWQESKEMELMQNKFWEIFCTNVNPIDPHDKNKILYNKIFIRLGSKFLNKYQHLLSISEDACKKTG